MRRARMILLVLCVTMCVQPLRFAMADDGYESSGGGDFSYKVIYGPSAPTIASTTKQVQVYAPNNFEAALIVLGFGNDSRVTDDVKAYLSNQSTGGTFYDFAQGFTNNNTSWGNPLMFQNLGMSSALSMNNSLYGSENVWSSEYDMTMYDGAIQRVQDVLDGNVGGNGGGSGGSGGSATNWKTAYCTRYSATYNLTSANNVVYSASVAKPSNIEEMPEYVTLNLSGGDLPSFTVDDTCYIVASFNNSIVDVTFSTFNKSMTVESISDAKGNEFDVKYINNTGGNVTLTRTYYRYNITGFNDGVLSCTYANSSTVTQNLYNGNTSTISTASTQPFLIYGNYGSGGGNPTVPPTNWPENPTVTPTVPPEVPSPTSPTIPTQPPEPVNPTSPTYPTIVYEPDVTYVNADLSAVLDAMNAHCKHLQDALHRECSNLWTNVSTLVSNQFSTTRNFLHTQFDWLIDSIDEEFDDFELYLKTLFEWLADQMSFTFTAGGYDDNTVVSWLKKIYSKLGGGVNTRPVDPTVQPDDWWAWLFRLFGDFIGNLIGLAGNELDEVTDAVEDLIHKFPFSVPWDIAALLGLLVSPPVTPQFSIPQYALTDGGLSQVGTYDVDLADYNSVWEGVRFIEKIGFAVFLAWNTTHFLDVFNKGGGKVTD